MMTVVAAPAVVAASLVAPSAAPAAADPAVVSASLTLKADPTVIADGAQVVLSGTLKGKTADGTVVPLTARKVSIENLFDSSATDATTDADGVFQTTVTPHSNITYQASFTLDGQEVNSHAVPVRVLDKAWFFDFTVRHDARKLVTTSARFALGAHGDVTKESVALQFSPDDKTWRTVQTLRPDHDGRLATAFRQDTPGWWRMTFAGDADYAPATTKVLKAWRWRTTITSFKATPRKLGVGRKIELSGVLKHYDAKHKKKPIAYAGRKVTVIFQCLRGDAWYKAVTTRTRKNGSFSVKSKTWCDAKFQVVYDGGSDTFRSYSKAIKIDTKGKALL